MKFSDRQRLVDLLVFVLALCFCVELALGWGGQIVASLIAGGPVDGDQPAFTVWRALAWVPVLLYLVTVLLSFPLPRAKDRDPGTTSSGRRRLPTMGRGALLFFGVLLLMSTSMHAISFLPEQAIPASAAYVSYVMVGAIALLLLRIVLGWLRLLPRSWRIPSEPAPGVVLPEQRLAPSEDDK